MFVSVSLFVNELVIFSFFTVFVFFLVNENHTDSLWCCHLDKVVVRVDTLYLINMGHRQAAAESCITPSQLSCESFRRFISSTLTTAISYYLAHPHAFIICCHPLVTLKSHLSLEKQPHILDPVTVLTTTNLSFITLS